MSYSEYAEHIEEQPMSILFEETFYVAPAVHWELSDFEDILKSA